MIIEHGVKTLSQSGLNIFLSAPVIDIPESIFPFSKEQKKKTLCLLANGGKDMWENITDFTIPDPIDNFSISKMHWFADNVLEDKIEILFPNDQHFVKLQQLGRYFGLSFITPLGIDISNEFGLWFAFRGVFLTDKKLPSSFSHHAFNPCDSCIEKPCMKAEDFLDARLKCPIKTEHQYTTAQIAYHQGIVANLKNQL